METFTNFGSSNFDPNQIATQTSSVILTACILDESPSIYTFEDNMNVALEEVFMDELKNCHRADDIMIQCTTFNENVRFKSGFQPINNLPNDYLNVKGKGRATALYDAVNQTLANVIAYRNDLEAQGIDVRTNIFIMTDKLTVPLLSI